NVRAWLFTIATNLSRTHFRAEGRRRRAMAMAAVGATEEGPAWPEGEAIANQASARIDRLVSALPFKQRVAFTMRKVHELDYDSIAQSLECSAESAPAHGFQALGKLRRGLAARAGCRRGR